MVRLGVSLFSAGIAALGMGLAARTAAPVSGVNTAAKADRLPMSMAAPENAAPELDLLSRLPSPSGLRLASLELSFDPKELTRQALNPAAAAPLAFATSFAERFVFDQTLASFDQRFAVAGLKPTVGPQDAAEAEEWPRPLLPLPALPAAIKREPGRSAAKPPAVKLASLGSVPATLSKPRNAAESTMKDPARPEIDDRTAVYDIAARTVYLPHGKRLEAHSGLGEHMDNIRSVALRARGPTPPNVYKLTLRERLFHGVRAIRLTPVDNGKMYGRDGILAHSYMLGPSGQSNGCVSFSDYPAFLDAYLNGEVDRMVVVERLDSAPAPKDGTGWIAQAIGKLFKPVEREAGHGEPRGTALSYQ